MIQGILFKVALDTELISDSWMYGGKKPCDKKGFLFLFLSYCNLIFFFFHSAMKAAAQEIKGIEYLMQAGTTELHFPLMARIDFKGFRVLAICVLPITKESLVYGSSDGGKTVLGGTPDIAELMNRAGTVLNLRQHKVAANVTMPTPGDIEVHLGTDGRLYTLDFARVMPPEAPSPE